MGRKSVAAQSEILAMALQTVSDDQDRVMMKNSVHITCATPYWRSSLEYGGSDLMANRHDFAMHYQRS